jgi:hypothetical protein
MCASRTVPWLGTRSYKAWHAHYRHSYPQSEVSTIRVSSRRSLTVTNKLSHSIQAQSLSGPEGLQHRNPTKGNRGWSDNRKQQQQAFNARRESSMSVLEERGNKSVQPYTDDELGFTYERLTISQLSYLWMISPASARAMCKLSLRGGKHKTSICVSFHSVNTPIAHLLKTPHGNVYFPPRSRLQKLIQDYRKSVNPTLPQPGKASHELFALEYPASKLAAHRTC